MKLKEQESLNISDRDFLEIKEIEIQQDQFGWSAYKYGIRVVRWAPTRKVLIKWLRDKYGG